VYILKSKNGASSVGNGPELTVEHLLINLEGMKDNWLMLGVCDTKEWAPYLPPPFEYIQITACDGQCYESHSGYH